MTVPAPRRFPEIIAPDPQVSGRIVVLDVARDLPFAVRRVYWIHGMRAGEARGAHGHRRLHQAIVAVAGGARFTLEDGFTTSTHDLTHPDQVLLIPPGHWRDFTALQEGTTLMVLASEPYDEADYIRDHAEFLAWARSQG